MRVWDGYFADPFVLRTGERRYYAYGTNPHSSDARPFEVLTSPDLIRWSSVGGGLIPPDPALGDAFWAPEVAFSEGRWWMYYSVGHDIAGHHIRVAVSDSPDGPFEDLGVNLTPAERFAIDAHPFRDYDGRWYLFFARDVLRAERPGTHLAVVPLRGMSSVDGPAVEVLAPSADWQLYESGRLMYGRRYDWHTLEGPAVVYRQGRYWLTYSGGAWTGPGYGVSWAVSDSPLGPWLHASHAAPRLLETGDGLIGPGHNSLTVAPDGTDAIAFHSWNSSRTLRQMHIRRISFGPDSPWVDGPTQGEPSRAHLADK